jgi:hypothetical protein
MKNLIGYAVGLCVFISSYGYGDSDKLLHPSRAAIQKELVDAEKSFNDAKQMFNAWYTGPLLAPSAHILAPGYVNIQPYLFITANYGKYSNSGKYEKTTTLLNINPQVPTLIGALDWMEVTISPQVDYNSLHHKSSFNFGDLPIGLGFGLIKETPYIPALLLSVQETFPTGKYQHLDPDKEGIDATGAGSFATRISLNFSKLVWWWIPAHPMNFRLALTYTIPSMVEVKGFNAYGGGFGTDGNVHPGQSFGLDFGYEYSFTQNWAGALDVVYTYAAATHFSGYKGVNSLGSEASVGGPFSEQLSLAPAIEYNWNENLGFIGGIWFTVWGRNSSAFVSGVLSVCYTF